MKLTMNIPNALSLLRIGLLPVLIALLFIPHENAAWVCLVLYSFGALTDFLDGWYARKFNIISEFGKFIDPLSDKIYVSSLLIALIASGNIVWISSLFVILIICREFFVAGLREYLGQQKALTLPVIPLAKWKTTTQMIAIGFLILTPYGTVYMALGNITLLIACGLSLYTGWKYFQTVLEPF